MLAVYHPSEYRQNRDGMVKKLLGQHEPPHLSQGLDDSVRVRIVQALEQRLRDLFTRK